MDKQSSFEGWAVIEIFGHQQEVGFVTTEAFGQAVMFRVDVPELTEREITLKRPEYMQIDDDYKHWPAGTKVKRSAVPGRSRLLGPGAIYAINPCTEEAARAALEKSTPRKLMLIEMPPAMAGEIAAPMDLTDEEFDEDDDDGDLCEDCHQSIEECTCPI
jgi:hypothetical protein